MIRLGRVSKETKGPIGGTKDDPGFVTKKP